jgi:hypothetical protein
MAAIAYHCSDVTSNAPPQRPTNAFSPSESRSLIVSLLCSGFTFRRKLEFEARGGRRGPKRAKRRPQNGDRSAMALLILLIQYKQRNNNKQQKRQPAPIGVGSGASAAQAAQAAQPPKNPRACLSQAPAKRGVCASLPAALLPVDTTHVAAVPITPAAISAKPPARPTGV